MPFLMTPWSETQNALSKIQTWVTDYIYNFDTSYAVSQNAAW